MYISNLDMVHTAAAQAVSHGVLEQDSPIINVERRDPEMVMVLDPLDQELNKKLPVEWILRYIQRLRA